MLDIFLNLPPEQLRKELSDDHVHRLSYFLIKAMEVLNYHPIVGEIGKLEEWKVIIDESSRFETRALGRAHYASRTVKNIDIVRTVTLMDVFDELNFFFGNENPVVDALKLGEFEDDPKLRIRLTDDELRGIERVDLAWKEAFFDVCFDEKGQWRGIDHIQEKEADNAQWIEDAKAKREAQSQAKST
jgi:hypothetical protein